ncbi:MAG: hypothetical protein K2X81_20790 [Candidatus Obscuribacterales bacterium]|nr:hypothetical protein [Candidatus Obscuribacterales bacterium]
MLKVLIFLECDSCQTLIAAAPDASHKDGLMWAAAAEDLEYDAQQSGWDLFNSNHTCNGCIAEAQYEQELSRV